MDQYTKDPFHSEMTLTNISESTMLFRFLKNKKLQEQKLEMGVRQKDWDLSNLRKLCLL